jgi:hypothetical protein
MTMMRNRHPEVRAAPISDISEIGIKKSQVGYSRLVCREPRRMTFVLLRKAIKPCQLAHESVEAHSFFCHSGAMRSIEPGIQDIMALTLLLYAAIKPCQLAHEGVEAHSFFVIPGRCEASNPESRASWRGRYFFMRRLNLASSRTKASKRAFAANNSRNVSTSSADEPDAHKNRARCARSPRSVKVRMREDTI